MKKYDEKYFDPLNTFQKLLCDLVSARKECEKAYLQFLSDKLANDLLKTKDIN